MAHYFIQIFVSLKRTHVMEITHPFHLFLTDETLEDTLDSIADYSANGSCRAYHRQLFRRRGRVSRPRHPQHLLRPRPLRQESYVLRLHNRMHSNLRWITGRKRFFIM